MSPELQKHLLEFDNLGFQNDQVYNWHKNILEALDDKYSINWNIVYYNNNKLLFENFMIENETYNFLNNRGLVNTGICPITGERILQKKHNYNIFGRVIYLSEKGLEVCKMIDRNQWNQENNSVSYDEFTSKKDKIADSRQKKIKILNFFKFVLSLIASFLIIKPNSILTYILFIIVAFVIEFILGRILKFVFIRFGFYINKL